MAFRKVRFPARPAPELLPGSFDGFTQALAGRRWAALDAWDRALVEARSTVTGSDIVKVRAAAAARSEGMDPAITDEAAGAALTAIIESRAQAICDGSLTVRLR